MTETIVRRRPARKPTARRPNPAASNGPVTEPNGEVIDVAELANQNTALLERIERLEQERVSAQFVEAQPDPAPPVREAADEELTPWQRSLRQQTRPVPPDFGGDTERPYNHRPRWYMKQDGSIVELQGSPQARAYYQDKGFRLLTKDEARHWLEVERPRTVALQNQKAHLITTLRRTVALDPSLKTALDPSWDGDLSLMTIEELQGQLEWIANQPTTDGRQRRMLERLPRLQDADSRRAEAEAKRMLDGVETNDSVSREDFLDKLQRGRSGGRDVKVTGDNVNQFR